MKKILTLTLMLTFTSVFAKDLKVLMIGNSFSICVGKYLPHIVKASEKHNLELTSAYIGGCPLRKHWANVEQTEADPSKKQYAVKTWDSKNPSTATSGQNSINALIKQADWDIITIQQASPESWKYENFQPFADNLIAYIREHAPNAEIVIQQTWSYRNDDARIDPAQGQSWGFDQTGMYERVAAAYKTLAEKTGFRVIPVGLAVQKARARLDDTAPDIVGSDWEKKDEKTGETKKHKDTIHLNARGEFLQAAVWYATLFGESANEIAFTPKNMTADFAQTLKSAAQEAVSEYK